MESVRKVVPAEEESRFNLHTYWKVFWRKKLYLVTPVVLAAVISMIGVRHLAPIYESFTIISIESKDILAQPVERYVTRVEEQNRLRNQQYRAMIEARIKSRAFLEAVVRDLGLDRSEPIRAGIARSASKGGRSVSIDELVLRHLVGLFKEKIIVESSMEGLFTIGVYDTDPATAYVLAKTVAEKFIAVTRSDQIDGIRQAGAFSEEQLAIYRDKLESSERELARLKREITEAEGQDNPVNALNLPVADALRGTLGAEVDRNDLALKRVRDRLSRLIGTVPSAEAVTADETIRNLQQQTLAYGKEKLLNDLQRQAAAVPSSGSTLASATDELRQRLSDIVAVSFRGYSGEIHPLIVEYFFQRHQLEYYREMKRTIDAYVESYRQNVNRKPQLEREANRLMHEVESNRNIYQNFLDSKTSARITEAVQSTNLGLSLNIIEPPERPLIPVKPNPLKIILLALIFGTACGFGTILATEYLDDSFRSIEEVERTLKVPVLGTIPKMASGFAWEKKKRGVIVIAWIIGLALFIAIMSSALYLYANKLRSTSLGVELAPPPSSEVTQ